VSLNLGGTALLSWGVSFYELDHLSLLLPAPPAWKAASGGNTSEYPSSWSPEPVGALYEDPMAK